MFRSIVCISQYYCHKQGNGAEFLSVIQSEGECFLNTSARYQAANLTTDSWKNFCTRKYRHLFLCLLLNPEINKRRRSNLLLFFFLIFRIKKKRYIFMKCFSTNFTYSYRSYVFLLSSQQFYYTSFNHFSDIFYIERFTNLFLDCLTLRCIITYMKKYEIANRIPHWILCKGKISIKF